MQLTKGIGSMTSLEAGWRSGNRGSVIQGSSKGRDNYDMIPRASVDKISLPTPRVGINRRGSDLRQQQQASSGDLLSDGGGSSGSGIGLIPEESLSERTADLLAAAADVASDELILRLGDGLFEPLYHVSMGSKVECGLSLHLLREASPATLLKQNQKDRFELAVSRGEAAAAGTPMSRNMAYFRTECASFAEQRCATCCSAARS